MKRWLIRNILVLKIVLKIQYNVNMLSLHRTYKNTKKENEIILISHRTENISMKELTADDSKQTIGLMTMKDGQWNCMDYNKSINACYFTCKVN